MSDDSSTGSPTKSTDDDVEKSATRKKYEVVSDMDTLPARMQLLLQKLLKFYANGSFVTTVLSIIRDRQPLALRDIDWLVTNYSKAFPVVYQNPLNKQGEPFNVHESYLQHEGVWKKQLFDPFQRFDRIYYTANGEKYETTIAQLNFFSWAIQYGVIDWAARHKDEIREHHRVTRDARKELIKAEPNREKKRMRLTNVDDNHCLVFVKPMQLSLANETPVADGKTVPPPIPKFF